MILKRWPEWSELLGVDGLSEVMDIECGMDSRKYRKVRFLLKDEGDPFMEIRTPYDALVAAWDVLESK